jgi:hypothetical protein
MYPVGREGVFIRDLDCLAARCVAVGEFGPLCIARDTWATLNFTTTLASHRVVLASVPIYISADCCGAHREIRAVAVVFSHLECGVLSRRAFNQRNPRTNVVRNIWIEEELSPMEAVSSGTSKKI